MYNIQSMLFHFDTSRATCFYDIWCLYKLCKFWSLIQFGAIHEQTKVAFCDFMFTNVHIMEITKTTIGPINEGEWGFLCKKYLSLYCYVGVFTICHQTIHILFIILSFLSDLEYITKTMSCIKFKRSIDILIYFLHVFWNWFSITTKKSLIEIS